MCLYPFRPLTNMHFLSRCLDCFPFDQRNIKSIINFRILQTLAVNLKPHKKVLNWGSTTHKTDLNNMYIDLRF